MLNETLFFVVLMWTMQDPVGARPLKEVVASLVWYFKVVWGMVAKEEEDENRFYIGLTQMTR
jgi:hypothetical protein